MVKSFHCEYSNPNMWRALCFVSENVIGFVIQPVKKVTIIQHLKKIALQ